MTKQQAEELLKLHRDAVRKRALYESKPMVTITSRKAKQAADKAEEKFEQYVRELTE